MAMDERESGNLIGSDKVEGTAVYGADDRKIGSIERVMIDKKADVFPMPCSASAAFSVLATTIIRCPGSR